LTLQPISASKVFLPVEGVTAFDWLASKQKSALRVRADSGPLFITSPVSGRYASAAQFQFEKGENSVMFRRSFPIFLAIMALSAMSVSVWAKNDSSNAITATIKITSATNVGSTKLAPGEYKLVAEGTQAKFEQGGKVVAEVPCTLKDLSTKARQTDFVLDNDHISEIQVSGKTKAIELSSGAKMGD
jgi:hypothetical protein